MAQTTSTPAEHADSDQPAEGRTVQRWEHRHHRTMVLSKSMFKSLEHADFRLLWFGNLAAMFAMQMQMVARGWLIVEMTGSAVALTWVLVSFMGPFFVLSLLGGVVADRLRKKWVMVSAQSLNAFATLILAVVIITGNVTFNLFIVFGIFNGIILAFSMPARQAIIPQIVGEEGLFNAMALSTASMNLSRIFAPAVAGVIAGGVTSAFAGVGTVFFVIGGCYIVSAGTLAALHTEGRSLITERQSVLEDIRGAIAYMRKSAIIAGLLVMTFIPIIFGMPIQLLLPVFNDEVLGGGVRALGWLYVAMGIGALIGSLVLAALGDVGRKGLLLLGACVLWAVFVALVAISTDLTLALIFMAFVGAGSTAFMAMNWTLLQLVTTPEMRGRVMSIVMMAFGLMPIGVIPTAFIAEGVGIGPALLVGAICLFVSTIAIGVLVPSIRRIDKGYGLEGGGAPPAVNGRVDTPQPQAAGIGSQRVDSDD